MNRCSPTPIAADAAACVARRFRASIIASNMFIARGAWALAAQLNGRYVGQTQPHAVTTTLIIDDSRSKGPRKVTKIVPYKAGGFGVLLPYHQARRGYLAKLRIDYDQSNLRIGRQQMQEYSAADRVKLSFHADGFVQFSGENPGSIVSGRDPKTGEPKGLGVLLEHVLERPISSGPTFGITAWGLDEFEAADARAPKNAVVFTEDDLYYRNCTPSTCNGYMLEAFIFPKRYWSAVRKKGSKYVLAVAGTPFEVGVASLEFTIVALGNQRIILGLMVSRAKVSFPSTSGFTISSPSDRRNAARFAYSLMATYPEIEWPDAPANTLDYQA